MYFCEKLSGFACDQAVALIFQHEDLLAGAEAEPLTGICGRDWVYETDLVTKKVFLDARKVAHRKYMVSPSGKS